MHAATLGLHIHICTCSPWHCPKQLPSERCQHVIASLPKVTARPVLQVVALATAIGVLKGSDSGLFAIALVLSLVVMYDASGAASISVQSSSQIVIFSCSSFASQQSALLHSILTWTEVAVSAWQL